MDPNDLRVDELAQAEVRQLAPVAALLGAADRNPRIRRGEAIDEHAAFPGLLHPLSSLYGTAEKGMADVL